MGNGTYSIKVLAHIADNRYATIFGTSLDAELEDENAPFLTAHQWSCSTRTLEQPNGQGATEDAETEIEKIEVICGYIVDNISL